MKITFLGATKTVTGSNFLLEGAGKRILIDCGLYQGKGFSLGFERVIKEANPNILKSNLYAYPQEMLNEYGYETIGLKIKEGNENELMNSQNYIGSIPGLLKIKSFVSSVKEGKYLSINSAS